MPARLAISLPSGIVTVEGVIFDMDGVLSDTQTIHARVESDSLRQLGITLSPEDITREFAGVADEDMFPRIFARFGKRVDDFGAFVEDKWKAMMEASRGHVRPMPGAIELVAALGQLGIPLAVASSSRHSYIELVLEELKLQDAFRAVVSAEEVAHSKPDPDIFLLAAKRIGVRPESCLVIEDSVNGMRAAQSAGMYCIGLVSQDGHSSDLPANLLVNSLQEILNRFQPRS
jgi:HAD superfamily hydrolase (TIGR01509 family)